MDIIKHEGKWRLLDRHATLILTDERTLDRIVEDPSQPLLPEDTRGFSGEKRQFYAPGTSLLDICKAGMEDGARRLEVSYDFFFGGSKRENYPDSPATLNAYKVISDIAGKYGMTFSASLVSPLDVGAGYARKNENTGQTMQFKECAISADGCFSTEMTLQTQWMNNKGPIALKLKKVCAYAFEESRIGETPYYFVDENGIVDISDAVRHEIDRESMAVSTAGYGCCRLAVSGQVHNSGQAQDSGQVQNAGQFQNSYKNRCLIVIVYETPELDYFSPDAGKYMKSIIDLHDSHGIRYTGFYSDEMHIQFDWDLENHFGHDSEINTRFVTDSLAENYARLYGKNYRNFAKFLIYFAYHQHDFLEGDEGGLPSQHVMGPDLEGILRTWRFRKRYFEMLQRHVVDQCLETKAYAESLFGAPIMTRAHSTWQEAPTCDRFFDSQRFSADSGSQFSRYDYTPDYIWSSSIRENISACYDYFKWNEYLTGGGTDHPEGGFLDRNYYGSAFASSLALLNPFPFSYYGFWGGPKVVMDRLGDVGVTYGNQALGYNLDHNFIQGMTPRISEVLTLYPLDLNYVEERYGSWMVQYGYTDYITDEQFVAHFHGFGNRKIAVKNRHYGTMMIFYSPLISGAAMDILAKFAEAGGTIVWCSTPAMDVEGVISEKWRMLFGVASFDFGLGGLVAGADTLSFRNELSGIANMEILTDLLPDFIYPVVPETDTSVVATINDKPVGTMRGFSSGGKAVFLGFRPRDDQSCSTGHDVSALFDILLRLGSYKANDTETLSRPADSRYIINRFPNGSISMANHMRIIRENWYGSFFRDEEKDATIMQNVALTPDEIELKQESIGGHVITYSGTGALTYRMQLDGRLDGFAGRNTIGIGIDGITYQFCGHTADIAWFRIDGDDLAAGILRAYAVRCSMPGKVTLPIDGTELRAALCGKDLHEVKRAMYMTIGCGSVELDIGLEEQGQWIALLQES